MLIAAWVVALVLSVAAARAIRVAISRMDGPVAIGLSRALARPGARVALGVLVVLVVAAVLAPWLSPYNPSAQPDILGLRSRPPSLAHLFGTDPFSRDVFSRVIHGARISLSVAVLAVLVSMTVGTAWGAIAGFVGGATDALLMRIVDALLAMPRVVLLVAVAALWGRVALPFLVLMIGLTGWFAVSRLVRAQVLGMKQRDFVSAARALGASPRRILFGHIVPNVLSPVIVAATLGVGNVVLLEAGLSYLGIGVRQPQASWGNIIQDGADQVAALWWVSLFPGIALVVTVMAFNVLGDALRDALDPRNLPAMSADTASTTDSIAAPLTGQRANA